MRALVFGSPPARGGLGLRCARSPSTGFRFAKWVLAIIALASTTAFANGRYPSSNQLVVKPGDPSTLVMRTTFGMLVTHDRKTWDWICETGAGYGLDGAVEDPAIALSAKGALFSAQTRGLGVSKDTGCGWGFALPGRTVVDVSIVRAMPDSVVAITADEAADAATPTSAQIHLSTDDGANFSPWGTPLDVLPLTLDVAPSDPHRVYATGERAFLGNASLFVGTDATNWIERPVPLHPSEAGAYIIAIDPKNPDRVYLRTYDAVSSRLLVTDDAGKTFTERFSTGFDKLTTPTPGLQAALSPDGTKIWVGSDFAHLQVASTTDFVFSKLGFYQPQCLVTEGTRLYMCLRDASNTFLAVSENGGQTFDTVLRRCALRGPIQCAAADAESNVCASEWPPIAQVLAVPCPPPGDGGAADGGASADGGTTPGGSTCGCSTASAAAPGIGLTALIFLGLSSRRRWARAARRTRRAPRP